MATNNTFVERDLFSQQKIEAWADSVIKGWVTRMGALGVLNNPRNTGMLARSFTYTVMWEARGADQVEYLHRIKFAFMAYGKFVDYGLGRGTDVKDRFEGGRNASENPRKRKQWIQDPWKKSLKLILPMLTANYGNIIRVIQKTNFEDTTDTHFRIRGT